MSYITVAEFKVELLSNFPEVEDTPLELIYGLIRDCDRAHQWEHVRSVLKLTSELCSKLMVSKNERFAAIMAALLHDIGCGINRKYHHAIASEMVYEILDGYVESSILDVISDAVKEHRSSYMRTRSSTVSDIVAVADRGTLNEKEYVKRSVMYNLTLESDPETTVSNVLSHFKDKFGKLGYNWDSYPELGLMIMADQIGSFKSFSDNEGGRLEDMIRDTVVSLSIA